MILFMLRGSFIVLACCISVLYVIQQQLSDEDTSLRFPTVMIMIGAALGIALAVIALDSAIKKKKLAAISGVFLGLVAGMIVTAALAMFVDLIPVLVPDMGAYLGLLQGIKVFIGLVCCYVCISLVLQTKDDFRFVIPYVEFAKQVRGTKPILLDTSIIIDGRIIDIIETQILQGTLIVPKFVLNELQVIADSADKLKRARGRRGLDILQRLQENSVITVTIDEAEAEGTNVDHKLISLAQHMPARVMTNDYNLNKIATFRGVDVINLNDLAKSLRPVALPGEMMQVKIVKPGEGPTQGVGYLEDGTMVVVENAKNAVNKNIDLTVTSTLQTSAGRMIFGRAD
ncbi:MAG: PIN/TRAM domain-containing protein [Phycisphaeraceae bacterium]|nr:PIN/TRAM domain-containing protein [Phycisphaeraceae bacterium]